MLKGIKLKKNLEGSFSGTKYFGIINNIKQVNTFVGVNNSGKSRFLRTIFSDENNIKFIFSVDENTKETLKTHLTQIFTQLDSLNNYGVTYKYRSILNTYARDIYENNDNIINSILSLYCFLSTIKEQEFDLTNDSMTYKITSVISQVHTLTTSFGTTVDSLGIENSKVDKIYIPILRGLRPIAQETESFSNTDIYLNRTKHDYFKNSITKGLIFTGLSIYEWIKKLLLGDESERKEIMLFESFLEDNVFKKKINLIPKYDDDVLHIKIGDDLQFPIYKLGDGLQTLIVILFPIFINRERPHLVFIEEPETHLHPKWQRLLYRSICLFEKHHYFLSTHSSVFINSPENSIFIISKKKGKTHILHSDIKTEKISILKDLGYKPNDLFQTNYLLWVEGQSDKIYLNYLIKVIDDSLIEGEDYSIMFYGGSSYKHFLMNNGDLNLEFIKSLNQNYALIMDSDRTKSGQRYNLKKKEIVTLFRKNKAFCWLTKLREIENYIPYNHFEAAVKAVHKVKNIEIETGDFGDRCKYVNLDAKPTFRPSIKLSNSLFSKIQKNRDGSLTGIKAKELRQEIKLSLEKTRKNYNQIDKIRVAEKIVQNGFVIESDELQKVISTIVKDINKANE
ncbi:AAA family ATPase [Arenibacter latericius]|uniref:AAA family ATPase n=1 Tax=Arenibacter latericius TaxID=86104 RepID=UPI000411F8EF|nr:ATP-binding protein [Arenibacter latericius]